MHGLGLLHELLLKGCPQVHGRRRAALSEAVCQAQRWVPVMVDWTCGHEQC